MNNLTFDAFTRRAATTVSRRSSLFAIGGAALGAAASPFATDAGKAGRKARKKCKKQVKKCKRVVHTYCDNLVNGVEQLCLDDLLPCCEPLKKCNAGPYTQCLIDSFRTQ